MLTHDSLIVSAVLLRVEIVPERGLVPVTPSGSDHVHTTSYIVPGVRPTILSRPSFAPGLAVPLIVARWSMTGVKAVEIELNGLPDEPLSPLGAPASTKSSTPKTGAVGAIVATVPVSVAEPTIPSGSLKVSETSYVVPA